MRWRARGTFAGPGRLQGNVPNGAKIDLEGCDVLAVADDPAIAARVLGALRLELAERLELVAPGAHDR